MHKSDKTNKYVHTYITIYAYIRTALTSPPNPPTPLLFSGYHPKRPSPTPLLARPSPSPDPPPTNHNKVYSHPPAGAHLSAAAARLAAPSAAAIAAPTSRLIKMTNSEVREERKNKLGGTRSVH